MLAALIGGQALTATELAFQARISRPTASEHLAQLLNARLISVTPSGRFRYYRITSPLVAQMLESMIAVAALEMPPGIDRVPPAMKRCALHAVATITWPDGWALRSRTR